MNALASVNLHTGRYVSMCPQLNLAFSVSSVSFSEEAEEAPTFGRGSSPKGNVSWEAVKTHHNRQFIQAIKVQWAIRY
jgi:hypothetical protein